MSVCDYVPGSHLAVVEPSGVVLVPAGTSDAVLAAVRDALAATTSASQRLAAVLDVLAGGGYSGLSAVPPFAAAVAGEVSDGGAAVDVVVRGGYRAGVTARGSRVDVDGLAVTSWREQTVADASGVELSVMDADVDGRRLPLGRGVVLADVVRLGLTDGADVVPPRVHGLGREPSASAPVVVTAEPRTQTEPTPPGEPPSSGEPPAPSVSASPVASPGSAPAPRLDELPAPPGLAVAPAPAAPAGASDRTLAEDLTVEDGPEDPPPGPPLVTGVPAAGASSAGAGAAGAEPLEDYSYLWGQTIVQAVESAAVRVGLPAADDAPVPQGDHDGETVHLEQLLAARRAQGGPGAGTAAVPSDAPPWSLRAPAGPVALSRTCGAGHPNPPHAAVCGRCQEPLTAAPRPAPRPALGRLRLSSGGTVELDRSVVLGRKPQANRVTAAELPRFVTVGGKEVSRNHLEVRLEDWNVLAVDLGSRNGTLLRRPGQPPVRLTANDPVPLRTGDSLDLGEGIVVTAEDLP